MIDDVIPELLNCNIQLLFHIYRCIEYSVNSERSGIKMRIDLLTDVARGWPGSCKHNSNQLSKGHSYDLATDTFLDHLESLSTSVIEILTACRLNGQCCGLYG